MKKILVSLVAVFAFGCSGSTGGAALQKINNAFETLCACPAAAGSDTCRQLPFASEADIACIEEAESASPDALGPSVDCANTAASNFETCVSNADCDAAAIQTCAEAFQNASAACPAFPESAAETTPCLATFGT